MTKMTRRKTMRTKTMKTRRPGFTTFYHVLPRFTTLDNGLVAPLIRLLNGLVAPLIRLLNKSRNSRPKNLVLLTIVTPAGSLAVQFIDGLGIGN